MFNQLLSDFQDDTGSKLTEEQAARLLRRQLPLLSSDLGVAYSLVAIEGSDPQDYECDPEMPERHRELWILRARIALYRRMQGETANGYAWKSGDMSADRHAAPMRWNELADKLQAEYDAAVKEINPDYKSGSVKGSLPGTLFERTTEEYEDEDGE